MPHDTLLSFWLSLTFASCLNMFIENQFLRQLYNQNLSKSIHPIEVYIKSRVSSHFCIPCTSPTLYFNIQLKGHDPVSFSFDVHLILDNKFPISFSKHLNSYQNSQNKNKFLKLNFFWLHEFMSQTITILHKHRVKLTKM